VTTRPDHHHAGHLLLEQIAFYEADAVPYDRWLASLADETNTTDAAAAAIKQVRRLAEWFAHVGPLGEVVEIAAGTGRVSQLIAPHTSKLVLLNSSPSSLALAGEKLAGCAPRRALSTCPPRSRT
jgi:hypothetical protein